MAVPTASTITRQQLAMVFKDTSTLLVVEKLLNNVAQPIPDALNAAQQTAEGAQSSADAANANAGAVQGAVDDLKLSPFVLVSADPDAPNGRVLDGSTGLTIDLATVGVIKLVLDVLAALGYTPANVAGDTFTGTVDVVAGIKLGLFTANADAPVNGYISVLDSAGLPVKLATIA